MLNRLMKLIDYVRSVEPQLTRVFGIVVALYVALAAFAHAQIPVLRELFNLLYPIVQTIWRIIVG